MSALIIILDLRYQLHTHLLSYLFIKFIPIMFFSLIVFSQNLNFIVKHLIIVVLNLAIMVLNLDFNSIEWFHFQWKKIHEYSTINLSN